MRVALAVGAALAVSCIGFEAAYAAAEESSTVTLIDNMKRLTERVEEMEQSRELDQRRIRELEEKLKNDPSLRASEQQDSDESTKHAEQADPLEKAVSQDLWSRNVGRGAQLRLLDIGLDILVVRLVFIALPGGEELYKSLQAGEFPGKVFFQTQVGKVLRVVIHMKTGKEVARLGARGGEEDDQCESD